ncbi:hypothetical protein [Pseudoduganella flava]|nr:hypothetical protein [Pseudoduganella flava]QGZ42335.1 hypothetical protein GO485_27080 [Pseudoduganella flava]
MNRPHLFVLGISLAYAVCVHAQSGEDERLVRGRASYLPASTYALLQKVERFCSTADKSAREPFAKALKAWHGRHAELLAENASVRDELLAEAAAPGAPAGLKATLDDVLNVQVVRQIDADYKKMVPPDSSRGWAGKAFVCGANAGLIDQGNFDLSRIDPAVAAYLEKRLQARRSGTAVP